MKINRLLIALAILAAGALAGAMGWSMWVMRGMMVSMAQNMDNMSNYMKDMGSAGGYMSTMSTDMAEMRAYLRNMAGTPAQLAAYHKAHPEDLPSSSAPAKSGASPCSRFHRWMAGEESSPNFLNLAEVRVDDVSVGWKQNESYLASIKRDMSEMDEHMFCMYLSMGADMAAMRNAMNVMTPSIASMGPAMGVMGRDMNRGVSSFTSPMQYMFNAMH